MGEWKLPVSKDKEETQQTESSQRRQKQEPHKPEECQPVQEAKVEPETAVPTARPTRARGGRRLAGRQHSGVRSCQDHTTPSGVPDTGFDCQVSTLIHTPRHAGTCGVLDVVRVLA
eukprot:Selendium_serpulae@DN3087_c0_g1_i2.p1